MSSIIAQPEWMKKECPYCHAKLGMIEQFERNHKKVFVCKNCHKKVDERNIFY